MKLPTWQRMAAALKREAMTDEALAEQVMAKAGTVRSVLNRMNMFQRLGDGRIALVERAHTGDGSF